MQRVARRGLVLGIVLLAACQRYDWIYQPKSIQRMYHLPFTVQTPSKADILFVIDNSQTMADKQQALKASVGVLLDQLAKNDTSYRIGIVSTDDIGSDSSCTGVPFSFPPEWIPAGVGNCDNAAVVLRWPHDGVRGRLLAAYEPTSFDPARYPELDTPAKVAAFVALRPTSATEGPVDDVTKLPTMLTGEQGVPWVIDRDVVRAESCRVCSCDCTVAGFKDTSCYTGCVDPVSTALVKAYFSSNVEGLGTSGSGWEQGTRSAMLATGINPEGPASTALDPAGGVLDTFDTYTSLDAAGQPVAHTRWLRDPAILGVMFVSDEDDCSMPPASYPSMLSFEAGQPPGSSCYMQAGQAILTPVQTVVDRLTARKTSQSKVALGVIGAVQPTGPVEPTDNHTISAVPMDCRMDQASGIAVFEPACSCLAWGTPIDLRWCDFTTNTVTTTDPSLMCQAMSGQGRYVQVADRFARHTYDTICQTNFGAALSRFALSLISACFEIDATVKPVDDNPANVSVIRTPRAEQGDGAVAAPVPYLASCSDPGPGWCYFPSVVPSNGGPVQNPQVCLVGFDRLIGDYYDISIVTTSEVDPAH